jgi:hypothetical protein
MEKNMKSLKKYLLPVVMLLSSCTSQPSLPQRSAHPIQVVHESSYAVPREPYEIATREYANLGIPLEFTEKPKENPFITIREVDCSGLVNVLMSRFTRDGKLKSLSEITESLKGTYRSFRYKLGNDTSKRNMRSVLNEMVVQYSGFAIPEERVAYLLNPREVHEAFLEKMYGQHNKNSVFMKEKAESLVRSLQEAKKIIESTGEDVSDLDQQIKKCQSAIAGIQEHKEDFIAPSPELLGEIVAHEVGHIAGLEHVVSTNPQECNLMNPKKLETEPLCFSLTQEQQEKLRKYFGEGENKK